MRRRTARFIEPTAVFLLILLLNLWGAPDIQQHFFAGSDHAFQLSMGRQINLGKQIYVNLFPHYGPLTVYTSAWGLRLHDSLLPETIICSAGYALAVLLAWSITRSLAGRLPAAAVVGMHVLMYARFYKWYYWLFPLVAAALLVRFACTHNVPRRRVLLTSGITAGLAFLYRPDLGVGCVVMSIAGVWILEYRREALGTLVRHSAWCAGAFSAVVLLFLGLLAAGNGPASVPDFFISFVDSARGLSDRLSLPTPRLSLALLAHPLEVQTASAIAFALLPALAGIGVVLCIAKLWQGKARLRHRLIGAICVGAFTFLPQAMHRSDIRHLFQVCPLFLVAAGMVLNQLWRRAPQKTAAWSLYTSRPLALAGVAAMVLMLVGLRPLWWGDLQFAWRSPVTKLAELARPLDSAPDCPIAAVARIVQSSTDPSDSLLVLDWRSSLSFYAHRPVAGFLTCYVPGLLTTGEWEHRGLRQIIADNPKLVVITRGLPIDGRPENEVSAYAPEIWAHVQREYPETVLETGEFIVRRRATAAPLARKNQDASSR